MNVDRPSQAGSTQAVRPADQKDARPPRSARPRTLVFRIRILIRVTRRVELHYHHLPVVYALLANSNAASAGTKPEIPEGIMVDAPEQCRLVIGPDEEYAFGFSYLGETAKDAGELVWRLVKGLRRLGVDQPTDQPKLGGNFDVIEVRDLVAGEVLEPGTAPQAISENRLEAEILRLRGADTLTLEFLTPLKWRRTEKTRADYHYYFDGDGFEPDVFCTRLFDRLRELGMRHANPEADPRASASLFVAENRLMWLDVAWPSTKGRRKFTEGPNKISGAVGRIRFGGVGPHAADALVRGQYVRVGEVTRFGFGSYRITELGPDDTRCARSTSLLNLSLGSAGLDRVASEFKLQSGIVKVSALALARGEYEPGRPFIMKIPKGRGADRTLAIPPRLDRALQRLVVDRLAPALDLIFEESSFAYRRGLSRSRAAARIQVLYQRGYRHALRADFRRFFDSIPHDVLEAKIRCFVADEVLTDALMKWVRIGAPAPDRGVPTGAPVSPMLANLFLDAFDEEIAHHSHVLVRYADDFLVLYKDRAEADAVFADATEAAAHLSLALNGDKTEQLDLVEPFTFLGYRFERKDRWRSSPTGTPSLIDDLGWHEAKPDFGPPADLAPLPGELGQPPVSQGATVIVGPGASMLRVRNGRLVCTYRGGRDVVGAPIDRIREVVVLGTTTLGASAVARLLTRDIPVHISSAAGTPWGILTGRDTDLDAEVLDAQVATAADEKFRLACAKLFVASKLRNCASLAEVTLTDRSSKSLPASLRALAEKCSGALSLDELLGFEGSGAAAWWSDFGTRLPAWFKFRRREAPAAHDPVNAMINLAQTSLHKLLVAVLQQEGLAPAIGLLHRPHAGHAALASDIQECFRHLMDRVVLTAARELRPRDFQATQDVGLPMHLKPDAIQRFMLHVQTTFAIVCGAKERVEARTYRHHMTAMARAIRRALCVREPVFWTFEHP